MEKLLTVKEYAKKENLSNSTIYKYIKNGKVDSKIKNGRKYIIDNDSGEIIDISVKILETKIMSLERYIQNLERENKELLKQIPLKKEVGKIKVELTEYLISLGITKKMRNKIIKKVGKTEDLRFQKENNKVFINLEKYNYKDLF